MIPIYTMSQALCRAEPARVLDEATVAYAARAMRRRDLDADAALRRAVVRLWGAARLDAELVDGPEWQVAIAAVASRSRMR